MDAPSQVNGSTPVNAAHHDNSTEHDLLPRPLSGPGASRQTRRLQLRNQGFRAAALPSRKATPTSMSSGNWSSAFSGTHNVADAENVSPSGLKAGSLGRRKSSGILQEIGNATLVRPKKARPRMSSSKLFGAQTPGDHQDVHEDLPTSPPPPKSTIKPRSVKVRGKTVHGRRSVSAEASKYIEHLEAELASAQLQLSSITSPSVTREQSSKMRTLNAETRQLQIELAEWEAKYEDRVQEEVDRHCGIETGLRSRIRVLEKDAEDTKFRIQELESQLESTTQSTEAVEAANVNLEKRLEIMSELLATSPTKIDLHTEAPAMRKRQGRPMSMLPRFPTTTSLTFSPERHPRTQPTSPLYTSTHASTAVPWSPDQTKLTLDTALPHSDGTSEAESVFSDAPITAESATTAEHFVMPNPWAMQAREGTKAKPARRMRRFGAGSTGPKPLILPSTSHCDNIPSSAPPLERHETAPEFSFPLLESRHRRDDSPSSLASRRRASTMTDAETLAKLSDLPFDPLSQMEDGSNESQTTGACPLSAQSRPSTRDGSSLGQMAGRNLMDELTAARTNLSEEVPEGSSADGAVSPAQQSTVLTLYPSHDSGSDEAEPTAESQELVVTEAVQRMPSITAVHTRRHSRTNSITTTHRVSAWERLHILFSDLWRSPLALARHMVQAAQARMRLPQALCNVQWWLVGVLLGPMAKRRMLARSACCSDNEDRPLLQAFGPVKYDGSEPIAYGTMFHTPPTSPGHGNAVTVTGGKGRKRVRNRQCIHVRSKHSPWLWLKFSITLAFAVGVAFKDGPGSLLKATLCACGRRHQANAVGENREFSATMCQES